MHKKVRINAEQRIAGMTGYRNGVLYDTQREGGAVIASTISLLTGIIRGVCGGTRLGLKDGF